MTIRLGVVGLIKLLVKLIRHKVLQYRLATNEYEIVNTLYGQVKGIKRKTLYNEDDTYFSFEGIPYAKPPVGDLRFRAPQPMEPWDGVLDCTTFKSKPMQIHFLSKFKEGSEDCLYLNIYTKKLNSPKRLPVMVWIYGGGYQFGEASRDAYAPDYFMQRDVILVTCNYRLGVFGFLSLNDPDLQIPGNAGLKDQAMALRWIKENIHNFNGDPNNITVFGESAGGASTHYLMLSPKTKGLFNKAILQSGVALCGWSNTPPRDWGYRLACHIGYEGSNNDKEVFSYLSKQSSSRLTLRNQDPLTKHDIMDQILFAFVPVIEPYDSDDSLLIKSVKEYLPTAWGNEIPIIIGGTSFEGLFHWSILLKYPFLLDELTDCLNMVPWDLYKSNTNEELKELGLRIKKLHFGDKNPSMKNTFYEYMDMSTYANFWHSIHRTIKARQAYASQVPTYCYIFDFDSSFFNHFRNLNCGPEARGACHSDDIFYLFHNVLAEKLPQTTMEYKCIQRMVGMWYNFALTGNPNCKEIAPTKWQPVTEEADPNTPYNCLSISDDIELKRMPLIEKLRIWDTLYTKENLF